MVIFQVGNRHVYAVAGHTVVAIHIDHCDCSQNSVLHVGYFYRARLRRFLHVPENGIFLALEIRSERCVYSFALSKSLGLGKHISLGFQWKRRITYAFFGLLLLCLVPCLELYSKQQRREIEQTHMLA